MFTDEQHKYSDHPLIIQSTQRLNTLDNEKHSISMDALGSLENAKQTCLSNIVKYVYEHFLTLGIQVFPCWALEWHNNLSAEVTSVML